MESQMNTAIMNSNQVANTAAVAAQPKDAGTAAATGSQANTTSFAAALNHAAAGNAPSLATVPGSMNGSLALSMAGLNPLLALLSQAQVDPAELEQAASEVLAQFMNSPAELQTAVMQDPELQSLIMQALSVMQSLPQTSATQLSMQTDLPLESPLLTVQKQEIAAKQLPVLVNQVLEAIKAQQGNPVAAAQLESSLKQVVDRLNVMLSEAHVKDGSKAANVTSLPPQAMTALSEQVGMQPSIDGKKHSNPGKTVAWNAVTGQASAQKPLIQVIQHPHVMLSALGHHAKAVLVQTLAGAGDQNSAIPDEAGLTASLDKTAALSANQLFVRPVTGELVSASGTATVSAQNLAQDLSQFITKNMKFTLQNGISEAKISLMPAHLGQVDVNISIQNGQLVAHFIAETLVGKDLLDSQLSQLRAALQNQGLQVDKLEVTQQANVQSGMFQDQRHSQQQQAFQRQYQQQRGQYDAANEPFSFETEMGLLHNQEVYGNTFNVTA